MSKTLAEEVSFLIDSQDAKNLFLSAVTRYRKILPDDELEGCRLRACFNAVKSYNKEKGVKFLSTWLVNHYKWECLNTIRKFKSRESLRSDFFDLEANEERDIDAHLDEFHHYFSQLSSYHQSILRYRFIDGKECREIAEILGVSKTTVINHVNQAILLLKKIANGVKVKAKKNSILERCYDANHA